jgi:hypothetical protein
MNLSLFSLRSLFLHSAQDARVLSHFRRLRNSRLGLYLGAQTPAAVPRFSTLRVDLGIPENAQAPLAKSSIRSKTVRFIFKDFMRFCFRHN